jgi:hypothetical protein
VRDGAQIDGRSRTLHLVGTLSTLGYGDIAPVAPLARTLSWLDAVTGQLYLAVLVARLIAIQGSHRPKDSQL